MKRNTWIGLGVGLAVVGGGSIYYFTRPKDQVKWRQAKLERGNVTQRINATGSVNPVVQVAVGTQVSGVISALFVDYNSIVRKGQIIAQIDSTVWETQLQDAQASLLRAQATYDFARADFERSKRLAADRLLAVQDLDIKETALKTAKGNFDSAQAALSRAKANLSYCTITAPVDGVVISRLADVGQTVAASFSTPNLFQIAQDLSKMKVQVNIGESDIDEVQVGQRAMFTVDSLPDRQFAATVTLVRQEPITTQNVVNYVVELIVPNVSLHEPEDGAHGSQATPEPQAGRAAKAGSAPAGREGTPDPEKAWERLKDRLPEGTTKAEFMQKFKARMAGQGQPGMGRGMGAGMGAGKPSSATPLSPDANALARIPGGASQLGGPKFTGSLALRPGMTANVTIVTNQRKDVLRVPNAALRFNPAAFLKDDKKAEAPRPGQSPAAGAGARPGAQTGSGGRGGMTTKREDRVWVLESGKPKAVIVKAGITDGQFTEVTGENLQEGLSVLVGVESGKPNVAGPAPLGGGPTGMRR